MPCSTVTARFWFSSSAQSYSSRSLMWNRSRQAKHETSGTLSSWSTAAKHQDHLLTDACVFAVLMQPTCTLPHCRARAFRTVHLEHCLRTLLGPLLHSPSARSTNSIYSNTKTSATGWKRIGATTAFSHSKPNLAFWCLWRSAIVSKSISHGQQTIS